MAELVLRNIVNLLEVLYPELHFLELTKRFIIDLHARLVCNVLVDLLQFLLSDICAVLNRSDQLVRHFGHFSLGLHNVLVHDDRCYVTNDEELICAAGNLDIDLIESDILGDFRKVVIKDVVVHLTLSLLLGLKLLHIFLVIFTEDHISRLVTLL